MAAVLVREEGLSEELHLASPLALAPVVADCHGLPAVMHAKQARRRRAPLGIPGSHLHRVLQGVTRLEGRSSGPHPTLTASGERSGPLFCSNE